MLARTPPEERGEPAPAARPPASPWNAMGWAVVFGVVIFALCALAGVHPHGGAHG